MALVRDLTNGIHRWVAGKASPSDCQLQVKYWPPGMWCRRCLVSEALSGLEPSLDPTIFAFESVAELHLSLVALWHSTPPETPEIVTIVAIAQTVAPKAQSTHRLGGCPCEGGH